MLDGETGGFSIVDTHGNEISSDENGITITSVGELAVSSDKDTKIQCDNFELSSDSDSSVSASGDFSASGNNAEVNATSGLTLKGNQLTANAMGTGELKANGPLTVESSAITKVAGATVMIN